MASNKHLNSKYGAGKCDHIQLDEPLENRMHNISAHSFKNIEPPLYSHHMPGIALGTRKECSYSHGDYTLVVGAGRRTHQNKITGGGKCYEERQKSKEKGLGHAEHVHSSHFI